MDLAVFSEQEKEESGESHSIPRLCSYMAAERKPGYVFNNNNNNNNYRRKKVIHNIE